jgi:catechol 2,3-dioxygenase-like lactoylglutathione lyase family enzyme
MGIDINGIAHLYIVVQDMVQARPFYEKLLAFFGMTCLVDTPELYYCIGGRTGVGIRAASDAYRHTPFDQYRAGLHHVCFRARSRQDVDELAAHLSEMGGHIIHAPQEDGWAPGYYSVLFEDPCGTRLEVNFVPGKGNLDPSIRRPLGGVTQDELSKP